MQKNSLLCQKDKVWGYKLYTNTKTSTSSAPSDLTQNQLVFVNLFMFCNVNFISFLLKYVNGRNIKSGLTLAPTFLMEFDHWGFEQYFKHLEIGIFSLICW